jgi:hypothetical protein
MKITNLKKGTAFAIIQAKNIDTVIQSNKIYPSGGYGIYFDASLKGNKLEVIIKDVVKPVGGAIAILAPAKSYLFKNYDDKAPLGYDKNTLTVKGPIGSKIEIILKDNYQNPGTEDIYECIL